MSRPRTLPDALIVTTGVRLTVSQKCKLDEIKRLTGTSTNEIIRTALREYFERHFTDIENELNSKRRERIEQIKEEIANLDSELTELEAQK